MFRTVASLMLAFAVLAAPAALAAEAPLLITIDQVGKHAAPAVQLKKNNRKRIHHHKPCTVAKPAPQFFFPFFSFGVDRTAPVRVEIANRVCKPDQTTRSPPMSDAPTMNAAKLKALELAAQTGEPHATVVARATAYHAFLTGAAAAPAPKSDAAPAPKPGSAAAGPKAPAAAGPKTTAPKAADPKPAAAAAKPAAAGPKATAPKAADPKAGASAAPVPPDTKAPGGTFTYGDVVGKLREVQQAPGMGKPRAFAILAAAGGKVTSVRDLKPANYDAVVAACAAALSPNDDDALGDPPEQTAAGLGADDDPTQGPPADDFSVE